MGSMGAGASIEPPFKDEAAALAGGKTQEEIAAWKAENLPLVEDPAAGGPADSDADAAESTPNAAALAAPDAAAEPTAADATPHDPPPDAPASPGALALAATDPLLSLPAVWQHRERGCTPKWEDYAAEHQVLLEASWAAQADEPIELAVGARRFLVHLANVPMIQENPADAMRSRLVRRVPKHPPTAAELRAAAQEETDAFMASCEEELAPLYAQLLAQQSWQGGICFNAKHHASGGVVARMWDFGGSYSYHLRCLGVAQNGEVLLDDSADETGFEPFRAKLTKQDGEGVLRWWRKREFDDLCRHTMTLTEHGLKGTGEDRYTQYHIELTPSK